MKKKIRVVVLDTRVGPYTSGRTIDGKYFYSGTYIKIYEVQEAKSKKAKSAFHWVLIARKPLASVAGLRGGHPCSWSRGGHPCSRSCIVSAREYAKSKGYDYRSSLDPPITQYQPYENALIALGLMGAEE
jgi:hypothetical protein